MAFINKMNTEGKIKTLEESMIFGKDFTWGTATASYQIEGAWNEGGKGLSIWDVYSHQKGNIAFEHNGDTACDHYHRYKEDVALLRELGVRSYRFSLSWPRLIPDGIGEINHEGVTFYNGLIDELLANGIEPCITLYHWDMPYALHLKGGFLNPDMPAWFGDYAATCGRLFGDRVKRFITINEPQCVIGHGYGKAKHAPGLKLTLREVLQATHILLLSHGKAVKALRETVNDVKIGYAPCGDVVCPVSRSEGDIEAARRAYFAVPTENYQSFNVSVFSDPVLLGDYPKAYYDAFGDILPTITKEDLLLISQPIDFYCQNIYNGRYVRNEGGKTVSVSHPVGAPMTAMEWFITPESLYWGPKFLYERYKIPIYITENGMANTDVIGLDGKIHDGARIAYMESYLENLSRAIADGVDVRGYYYWSLLDNFEWNFGYTRRFGLVYVDYDTFARTKKDSFYYYRDVIRKSMKE